ncbi:MAG: hypothetical protein AVDCRST_MAG93-7965 [uncultured Chloroflexia bacterium]|uniref:Bacterial Ig domain-containing protein n=1 Tax=uncultured Chloroflexia bacterium TaxID=1672391 RepID=A0A6J4MQ95_9CHLR|nr:MAG: hypothetical protein AVDCRST_MAG93-7965 [uncultured Chloroflexia bacterium]
MVSRTARNLIVPLMLALSLAACGGNSAPPMEPPTNNSPTPTTPAPKEISGTIDGWLGGEAGVRAESTGSETGELVVLAEGTISADGSFSLTLPVEGEALAAALFTIDSSFTCAGPNSVSTVEITPGPFETVFVKNYFRVYDSTDSSEVV